MYQVRGRGIRRSKIAQYHTGLAIAGSLVGGIRHVPVIKYIASFVAAIIVVKSCEH